MTWSAEQPFQSLALTGGGYRGLFTAQVLCTIEEHLGEPIGRRFDLIAGTSIGGIVALAVAFEIPMRRVVDAFVGHGESIFPPSAPPRGPIGHIIDLLRHRQRPRYSSEPLRTVISELLGADTRLGDALHPVLIPAVNVTTGVPQIFKTPHLAQWVRDQRYRAVDVALATSAAPTFFELAEIDKQRYTDGGLFANAPDLIALHEAEHFLGVPPSAQRMLSIGTTGQSYSLSHSMGRGLGIGDWMQGQRLLSVMISAQQQFAIQHVAHRLGERHLRLDRDTPAAQAQDLGLDRANAVARDTLIGLGSKTASDALSAQLAPFLQHRPQLQVTPTI